jgi:hypothetical protein
MALAMCTCAAFHAPQLLPNDGISHESCVHTAAAGLSDTFILMDDDLFLTAPWTLADFVGPDGGQVLTGQSVQHALLLESQQTTSRCT